MILLSRKDEAVELATGCSKIMFNKNYHKVQPQKFNMTVY